MAPAPAYVFVTGPGATPNSAGSKAAPKRKSSAKKKKKSSSKKRKATRKHAARHRKSGSGRRKHSSRQGTKSKPVSGRVGLALTRADLDKVRRPNRVVARQAR
jgi:hypothetical protein